MKDYETEKEFIQITNPHYGKADEPRSQNKLILLSHKQKKKDINKIGKHQFKRRCF